MLCVTGTVTGSFCFLGPSIWFMNVGRSSAHLFMWSMFTPLVPRLTGRGECFMIFFQIRIVLDLVGCMTRASGCLPRQVFRNEFRILFAHGLAQNAY